eukprot:COSAG06_NODE_16056_length_1025_cov_1.498920_2_plen_205_part_01
MLAAAPGGRSSAAATSLPPGFPLGGSAHGAYFSTAPLPAPLPAELQLLEQSAVALKKENDRLERRLRDARAAAARVVRFAPPRPRPAARPLPAHCYRLTLALHRWRAQFGGGVALRPALCYWESWGVATLARTVAALRQNRRRRALSKRATRGNYCRLAGVPFTSWKELALTAHTVRMHVLRRTQQLARALLAAWHAETAAARHA